MLWFFAKKIKTSEFNLIFIYKLKNHGYNMNNQPKCKNNDRNKHISDEM